MSETFDQFSQTLQYLGTMPSITDPEVVAEVLNRYISELVSQRRALRLWDNDPDACYQLNKDIEYVTRMRDALLLKPKEQTQ